LAWGGRTLRKIAGRTGLEFQPGRVTRCRHGLVLTPPDFRDRSISGKGETIREKQTRVEMIQAMR
jgi:hypothetical protein